ncbi:transcription activator protein [Cotton leaf curl Kokhran virus]|uniref:Replication enhancer protein n=1 Tax=Cotton leaf curl Kokhran virus TaxID=222464 RepID=D3Y1N4_9GEMI|nr:transcription activator protein [Cotton leaf curl Kokhran virus]
MRSSSLSKDHCTQLSIKVQHREARDATGERIRSCSPCYSSSVITATPWIHAQGNPSLCSLAGCRIIWRFPSLYFRIISHVNRPFTTNMDILTIRIQFNHNLRKALGIHKCFIAFRIWMTSQPPTGRFLRVFTTQVLQYLIYLGIVSII